MAKVQRDELRKLPYVDHVPIDSRITLLRPFYDHVSGDWILHIPSGDGKLERLAGGEPIIGGYFSLSPADPTQDLHFPLGTFVAQYASYEGVVGALQSLESDIFELACSLRKYDLITTQFRHDRMSAAPLLSSELAYLIINVRSLYDVLQKLSKNLLRFVMAPDDPGKRVIEDLDDSFARLVLKGDRIRTSEDLTSTYRLPPPLAAFYAAEAQRFKVLRDLRIGLEHHGRSLPTIFCLDSGPAVSYVEPPWSDFGPWDQVHVRQDRFGSLRWLFSQIALDAIDLTTRYFEAFAARIAVKSPLSERIQLYLRHPFGSHLVDLPRVVATPWEWE